MYKGYEQLKTFDERQYNLTFYVFKIRKISGKKIMI
jgi:hypothetical protein